MNIQKSLLNVVVISMKKILDIKRSIVRPEKDIVG